MKRRKNRGNAAVESRADRVKVLEETVRENNLKMQEYEQRAVLGAMAITKMAPAMEQSSFYIDNVVDPRDYLGNEFQSPQMYAGVQPTQIWNREDGRNFPIYLTEVELRYIRGMGRMLSDFHPIGKGIMGKIVNYTAGTGVAITAAVKKHGVVETDLLRSVNAVIEEFMDYNDISCGADREVVLRSHRDGDGSVALWHEGGSKVALRFVEPDQITQPANEQQILEWMGYDASPSTMMFGIHSDSDDVMNVHGYYVQWNSNGQDWDYLPGGKYPYVTNATKNSWCEFFKSNVDRQIKRGVSDFFPVESALRLISKVMRNTGEGAAVQAAIAFIRQHAPGITPSQIFQFQSNQAADQTTMRTALGNQNILSRKMYPGMVLDIPKGQQYMAGPMGVNNAEIYVEVADALCRSVAVRWDMPEWMLNSNTKNNNRASGFIAESPFLKNIGVEQNLNSMFWKRIIWKVLEWSCASGALNMPFEVLTHHIKLDVRFPQISIRQPEKETARRQILCDNGVLSPKEWALEEGYDYDQQVKDGAQRFLDSAQKAEKPEMPPGVRYGGES
jgi:hypothetical protein